MMASDHEIVTLILEVNIRICNGLIQGIKSQIEKSVSKELYFLEQFLEWLQKKRIKCQVLSEEAHRILNQLDILVESGEGSGNEIKIEFLAEQTHMVDDKFRDLELYPPFSIASKHALENIKDSLLQAMENRGQEEELKNFLDFDN